MKFTAVLFFFLTAVVCSAQVPQRISYQATIRDDAGELVRNQLVGLRIRILRDSLMQIPVYSETHQLETNRNGLVSLQVGGGKPQFGVLDTINWGASTFFIETAVSLTGGTAFQIMGASQFLAVPYALYALRSGSVDQREDTTESSGYHYVGEHWGGGVVFEVWTGSDGKQHGLIVSLKDQSDSIQMHLDGITIDIEDSEWNGQLSTSRIAASATNPLNAASVCLNYRGGGYNDWYLPSRQEATTLLNAASVVNRTLDTIPDAQTVFTNRILNPSLRQNPEMIFYWTSSVINADIDGSGVKPYFFALTPLHYQSNWTRVPSIATLLFRVRAIREF